MNLIEIEPNVFINTDRITKVEIVMMNDVRTLTITADGETYISNRNPDELLSELKTLNLNTQRFDG